MMNMMFGFDGIAACSREAAVSDTEKIREMGSSMRRGFG